MKRTLIAIGLLSAATLASAETWRFFPAFKESNYKLQPTVALTGGLVNPDNGPNARSYGLEVNFNCGLVQTSDNRIRTYVQLNRSNKSGVKVYNLELSPRYTLPLANGFYIGGGPSLANVHVKTDAYSKNLIALGAAVGLDYRIGDWYAGADVRVHDTFKSSGVQYDHSAFGVKVGLNF
jgi:hypothetical protein